MPGRIEAYIHSDSQTANKGGCLMKIRSQTDFAARTDEFIEFCKEAAKMAYAASVIDWVAISYVYPEMEQKRKDLEQLLKEKIQIDDIWILKLDN